MRTSLLLAVLLAAALPASAAQYLERVESPVYPMSGTAEVASAKAKDCFSRIAADGEAKAKFTSMLVPYEVTSKASLKTSGTGAQVIFDEVRWRRGGGGFEKVGKWLGSGWKDAEKALLGQAEVFGRCLQSGGAPEAGTRKAFDALKSLAGTWTMDDGSGKTTEDVFELAARSDKGPAGATAVIEKNPGFAAVYQADGDAILVTLYAEEGVQPRLRAKAGSLDFAFVDATNARPGKGWMTALSLELDGPGHLIETWTWTHDGRGSPVRLELRRRK